MQRHSRPLCANLNQIPLQSYRQPKPSMDYCNNGDALCEVSHQISLILDPPQNHGAVNREDPTLSRGIIDRFMDIFGFPPVDLFEAYITDVISGSVPRAASDYEKRSSQLINDLLTLIISNHRSHNIVSTNNPNEYQELQRLIDSYVARVIATTSLLRDKVTEINYSIDTIIRAITPLQ